MELRTLLSGLAAGASVFLVVGAAVSELLVRWIEFSVLLGLPVGAVCGGLVAAFVVRATGRAGRPGRLAAALGAYGVVSLAAFGVGLAVGGRVSVVLVVGVAVGLLAGVVAGRVPPTENWLDR